VRYERLPGGKAFRSTLPDDGLRDFVEWAYWTGMRKGEIAKLEWAVFERETGTFTFPPDPQDQEGAGARARPAASSRNGGRP